MGETFTRYRQARVKIRELEEETRQLREENAGLRGAKILLEVDLEVDVERLKKGCCYAT